MNDKTQKTYVDGLWLKEVKFNDGGSILKVSLLVEKFAQFVKKNKKADGWVNFVISAKRNPDDKSTHYAYLDTWEPKTQTANATPSKAKTSEAKTLSTVPENDETDF